MRPVAGICRNVILDRCDRLGHDTPTAQPVAFHYILEITPCAVSSPSWSFSDPRRQPDLVADPAARWNAAFTSALWPILGVIFVPWTTMMYVIVFPGGIVGWDWLWIGLGLLADIGWWSGGGFRRRVPGYTGQY